MDIGASTGGFTDCMLQNGARKVFSIDVGYGQLAWKLRQDDRVICMERTNIRYVTIEDTKEFADFASIDVSFISLKLVLPVAHNLIIPGGEIVALIKPQFEAGKDKVGKKDLSYFSPRHKPNASIIIDFPAPVSPVNIFKPLLIVSLDSSIKAQFFIYISRIILNPLFLD